MRCINHTLFNICSSMLFPLQHVEKQLTNEELIELETYRKIVNISNEISSSIRCSSKVFTSLFTF